MTRCISDEIYVSRFINSWILFIFAFASLISGILLVSSEDSVKEQIIPFLLLFVLSIFASFMIYYKPVDISIIYSTEAIMLTISFVQLILLLIISNFDYSKTSKGIVETLYTFWILSLLANLFNQSNLIGLSSLDLIACE